MTGQTFLVSTTTGRVLSFRLSMDPKAYITAAKVVESLGLPRGGIRTIYWSNGTLEIKATLPFRLNAAVSSFNLHHKGKLPIEFKFFIYMRISAPTGTGGDFCVLGRVHAVRGLIYEDGCESDLVGDMR
ncbi:hypothetical protein ARMGADRAFT_567125 [Armillaria gallica]|uniref:Uncharacterized protein n=1 Tax=Armillaria gallica TaxID=47427 RepID=A0A2H3DVH8_ARMGA|nr:hypothetical protein ARMGADRAFT_567125 [Armillaria gallica]